MHRTHPAIAALSPGSPTVNRLIPLCVAILLTSSAFAQTPGLVQAASDSMTMGYNSTNVASYQIPLPAPTHPNNVVLVHFGSGNTSTPGGLKVVDDASTSNTYTLLASVGSTSLGDYLATFCAVQTNPAQRFTVETSATDLGTSYVMVSVEEFYNVNTGSGGCTSADQTWTLAQTTASTTVDCGSSSATTTAGDLISMFVQAQTIEASYAPGSQSGITWNLTPGSAQLADGYVQQWGVHTVNTAINPSLTLGTSTQYTGVCVALKAATSGGAPPSSLYVAAVEHIDSSSFAANYTSPLTIQIPTTGNLVVLTGTAPGVYPSAISSSVSGETWYQAALNSPSNGSFIWYACATSPSNSRELTITLSGGNNAAGAAYYLYDVANASTATGTGCFDTGGFTSGDQTVVGGTITYSTGPFAAPGEIVFASTAIDDSGAAVLPQSSGWNYSEGGFVMSGGYNQCDSNISPPQPVDECDSSAFSIVSSTSTTSPTLSHVTNGSADEAFNYWYGAWGAFKPAVTSTPAPPTNLQAVAH
jgi:hypothetical protein